MKEIYNFEDFKDKIKQICGVCQNKIENNWATYQLRGNYCSECNARCQVNSKDQDSKEYRARTLDVMGLDK